MNEYVNRLEIVYAQGIALILTKVAVHVDHIPPLSAPAVFRLADSWFRARYTPTSRCKQTAHFEHAVADSAKKR